MTRRREGYYRCERCDGPHQSIGRHNDGGVITVDDRPELTRAILGTYADIGGPASLGDTQRAICPRPATLDGRTREVRAFHERLLEMYWLSVELAEGGLLRLVDEDCGDYPWGFEITAKGRAHLAWTKAAEPAA